MNSFDKAFEELIGFEMKPQGSNGEIMSKEKYISFMDIIEAGGVKAALSSQENQTSTPFDRSFTKLMILEGHQFTDDPNDQGGPTKFGILKLAYPDEDIQNLTLARAKELYRGDYWDLIGGDDLEDERMAMKLFQMAVHSDPPQWPRRTGTAAQMTLIIHKVDVELDGVIGPQTVNALNHCAYRDSLLKWLNVIQGTMLLVGKAGQDNLMECFNSRIDQLREYGRGWGRRLEIL